MNVGEEGLEPSRVLPHRNLNPARLPIPPLAQKGPRWYYRTGDIHNRSGILDGRASGPGCEIRTNKPIKVGAAIQFSP